MTIQRVLHLNQNVSLHHRLSSSPFLCCFFSSSSSSCFFGTLAKEVFAFSIKKRERKRRAFFCVSRPSLFSSFPAPLKETKKKSSFFSSTIWREQTNERECVAEIEKYDRRKSPKRRRSIEEGTFPFLLCRFVFLFLIRMLFRFERRERKGNHQKSPKKERKNSLGPKNSGSSSSSSFFCSKNEPPKNEGGYKINSGSCRKLLSLNYNWAIQIPIGVINLNTRTHTYI